MKVLELKKDIHWVGMLDPNLRIFDIIMHTEFGTTYNSYVVKGTEKTALFETVKVKFFDEYIEKLKTLIDVYNIDYIVLNHTEPDHAGSVAKLLEYSPNAKVVGSTTAVKFMKAIANKPFEAIVVNSGDTLELGGKTLKFISAPFLHWPDSIYTYIEEDKVLFTCDSFGSHYSMDAVLFSKLDNRENYMKALRYYFDMIMGPFKPHMLKAIEKIEGLDIDIIGTGHGPVLDKNPMEIVNICKEWSTEVNPNTTKSVVIPYVSAYGYTAEMAETIAKGVASVGDVKIELFDMVYADFNEVLDKIYWADGLLLGSPTINSEALPPIWNILTNLSPIVHGKKLAGAFGSYGWSGEAVPNLTERLKQLRMKVVPGLKVNFKPSDEELKKSFEFGVDFGQRLVGIETTIVQVPFEREKKAALGDGTVKQWRCIICNEVFDGVEPPDLCPACGASHEQFEEYEEASVAYTSTTEASIVIVGNNAAGTAACESIRKRNKEASILMISSDDSLGYYRPMLSDYISGSYNEKMFLLHPESWYSENNIQLQLGTTVTSIDATAKTLKTDKGETISYDKLILANGSRNTIPPITDSHLKGVFTIKTKSDADQIIGYAKDKQSAIVVGGGLLGLEAAWELRELGLEVTVIEVMDRLLPRQLDTEASALLETGVLKTGIQVVKGSQVSSILGKDVATGIQLIDGRSIAADFVIISAGVMPNKELGQSIGIKANRGLIVDDHMRTNIENIYAAGDVAEFNHTNFCLWPIAIEQGKIAGANAVGDDLAYAPTIGSSVFSGMNMNIFSIGDIADFETRGLEAVTDYDKATGHYKKFYFEKQVFKGGILIGDVSKSLTLIRGIGKKALLDDILRDVLGK